MDVGLKQRHPDFLKSFLKTRLRGAPAPAERADRFQDFLREGIEHFAESRACPANPQVGRSTIKIAKSISSPLVRLVWSGIYCDALHQCCLRTHWMIAHAERKKYANFLNDRGPRDRLERGARGRR